LHREVVLACLEMMMKLNNLWSLFLACLLLGVLPGCVERPDRGSPGDEDTAGDDDDTAGDDDDTAGDDDDTAGDADDTAGDDDDTAGDDDDTAGDDDDTAGDDDDTAGDDDDTAGDDDDTAGDDDDTAGDDDSTPEPAVDNDGDGFAANDDCDDSDPSVHPSAFEICDGIDNDCDGQVDPTTVCGVTDLLLLDGYDGSVYGTADAGVTWTLAGTAPISAPAKVALVSRADGGVLATTTHGDTWVSQDGGSTWSAGPVGPWGSDGVPSGSPAHNVALDAAATGLFAISTHSSRDGHLYESTDDGGTWNLVATWPMQTGMDTDLAATPLGEVYIGNSPYEGALVYHYDGSSSVLAPVGSYDSSGSGGAANLEVDVTGAMIAAANPEVTFFSSADSGVTWGARGDWIDPRAVGTIANAGAVLYAVSVKGPVLRSEDQGWTWLPVGDWGTVATHNVSSSSGWIDLVSLP